MTLATQAQHLMQARLFRAAFRGVPTGKLVSALNRLTPGFTWTGCSKEQMATEWARGWGGVTLQQIKQQLESTGVRE